MWRAELVFDPFCPNEIQSRFQAGLAPHVGALASFTGYVRGQGAENGAVTSMFLQHHPRMTLLSLQSIARAAADRFGTIALGVVHRAGTIAPGEAIVWVSAASTHRRAAFDAVDYCMDRLKTEAILWKREDSSSGGRWIEPTDQDHRERGRWE